MYHFLPVSNMARVLFAYVRSIASQAVECCTLLRRLSLANTKDAKYNYAIVLCHYGVLVMEFLDSGDESDGEWGFHCWRLFLTHFRASGRTKYSLQALRLRFQVKSMLSPQLAHEVMWHRFVNIRGTGEKYTLWFIWACKQAFKNYCEHGIKSNQRSFTDISLLWVHRRQYAYSSIKSVAYL